MRPTTTKHLPQLFPFCLSRRGTMTRLLFHSNAQAVIRLWIVSAISVRTDSCKIQLNQISSAQKMKTKIGTFVCFVRNVAGAALLKTGGFYYWRLFWVFFFFFNNS